MAKIIVAFLVGFLLTPLAEITIAPMLAAWVWSAGSSGCGVVQRYVFVWIDVGAWVDRAATTSGLAW